MGKIVRQRALSDVLLIVISVHPPNCVKVFLAFFGTKNLLSGIVLLPAGRDPLATVEALVYVVEIFRYPVAGFQLLFSFGC